MVAVVDYGLGNLGSIANMIKAIGEKSVITNEKDKIAKADRIILPGVGAYDAGITNLEQRGLVEFLKEQADSGKPIMGICLGMQLLGTMYSPASFILSTKTPWALYITREVFVGLEFKLFIPVSTLDMSTHITRIPPLPGIFSQSSPISMSQV